jgi:cell fate regulator YaaT (PSP1 superfamily)
MVIEPQTYMEKFLIGYSRGSNAKGVINLKNDKSGVLKGKWCLYENELGTDLARIICVECKGECDLANKNPLGDFIRLINDEDVGQIKRIKQYEKDAPKACKGLIENHLLPKKIVRTTLSFDDKRLTFYFFSEERVDFRLLVKDLVSRFHKMIRLQQIGPRDHARIVNGVGICGRELCCARFLNEVSKITKDAASEQGMEGLSSDKISGVCGKLMCCLKYELEDYNKSEILKTNDHSNNKSQISKHT